MAMKRRTDASFVTADPPTVTADFLRGVHDHLSKLAGALERQADSAGKLLRAVRREVGVADENWRGARSRTVVTSAQTYLADVNPYPEAVSEAARTIRRWARAALETAELMARLEQCVPDLEMVQETPPPARRAVTDGIEELRVEWGRRCVTFAGELDGATAAITGANTATVIPIDGEWTAQEQLAYVTW